MAHESSFDIVTAADFFHKIVLPEYEDFISNNASSRHALLTTIVVYHMYEWVNPTEFSVARFNLTYPHDTPMADAFEMTRKITNGTKHFKPRATTRTQKGFSLAFSDGFARPLMVEYPDGREQSVDVLLREMIDFWRKQEANGAF